MIEDFSTHPKSLTETKADRTKLARDNTPRDVLVAMLRGIDDGTINPAALVLGYIEPDSDDPGEYISRLCVASPNTIVSAGIGAMITEMLSR